MWRPGPVDRDIAADMALGDVVAEGDVPDEVEPTLDEPPADARSQRPCAASRGRSCHPPPRRRYRPGRIPTHRPERRSRRASSSSQRPDGPSSHCRDHHTYSVSKALKPRWGEPSIGFAGSPKGTNCSPQRSPHPCGPCPPETVRTLDPRLPNERDIRGFNHLHTPTPTSAERSVNASDGHTEEASDEAVLRRLADAIGPCPERVTESVKALFQVLSTQRKVDGRSIAKDRGPVSLS